jgi:hypothetical protein
MSESDPQVHVVALELPRQPEVVARFLPAQLQIDKLVPWAPQPTSRGDVPNLQFAAAQGRLLSIRLLLDRSRTGASVQPELDRLSRMANVISQDGAEDKKRPPKIAVRRAGGKLPDFEGVVESLSIQYVVFRPDGTPVSATADLRVREADRLRFVKKP